MSSAALLSTDLPVNTSFAPNVPIDEDKRLAEKEKEKEVKVKLAADTDVILPPENTLIRRRLLAIFAQKKGSAPLVSVGL